MIDEIIVQIASKRSDFVKDNAVNFRIATASDVVNIYRVISYRFPDKEEGELIRWLLDIITNNGIIFIAEVSGRIVGALCFKKNPLINGKASRECLSSEWLYIHKAYLDQHISIILVNIAKNYALENNMMIKLKSSYGVCALIEDMFFKFQEFGMLGENFIYVGKAKNN